MLFQPAPVIAREATHLICVLIFNSDYNELRQDKNFRDFHDIPEVTCDIQTVLWGLQNLTVFDPKRVFQLENKSTKEINDTLRKTVPSMIKQINKDAEKTGTNATIMTFVYYAGYGILDD